MIHGQFLQPDHGRGDANTIGGYMAVHDRPAAFEGADGFSYSVEILTDPLDDNRWGAFFFFVRWARMGEQVPQGHLETEYIAFAATEPEARARAGALSLDDVKRLLDQCVVAYNASLSMNGERATRRWWDAMHDD